MVSLQALIQHTSLEKDEIDHVKKKERPKLQKRMKSIAKINIDQINENQDSIETKSTTTTTVVPHPAMRKRPLYKKSATMSQLFVNTTPILSKIKRENTQTPPKEQEEVISNSKNESNKSVTLIENEEEIKSITTTNTTNTMSNASRIEGGDLNPPTKKRSKSFARRNFSLKNLMQSRMSMDLEQNISKIMDDVFQKELQQQQQQQQKSIENKSSTIKTISEIDEDERPSSPGAHLRQQRIKQFKALQEDKKDTRSMAMESHTAFKEYFSCKSDKVENVQTITKQELYATIVDKALSILMGNYFKGNVQWMEKNVPIEYTVSMYRLHTMIRPIFNELLMFNPNFVTTNCKPTRPSSIPSKDMYAEEDSSDYSEEGSPLLSTTPMTPSTLSTHKASQSQIDLQVSDKVNGDVNVNMRKSDDEENNMPEWNPTFSKEMVDWYVSEELNFKEQLYQKPDQLYSLSTAASKGSHPYMEDAFTVYNHVEQLFGIHTRGASVMFMGVFDGHRGQSASTYARAHLCSNIVHAVTDWEDPLHDGFKEAIVEGYKLTNSHYLSHAKNLNLQAGTCASTTFLISEKNKKHLIVGNVGDTQVILGSTQHPRPIILTTRHDPANEKRRIRKAGGEVVYWMNTARVNGILGVSRSIGDAQFNHLVPAIPDVKAIPLEAHHDCLIMATDGLWDVMNDREVLEFVRKYPKREAVARALVQEAQQRRSKDNCTVLVLFFNQHNSKLISSTS